jgi:hypothetical protein
MVTLVARIAGDEEVLDRGRAARDSAEKFSQGDAKVAGGPSLEQLIGDGPLKALRTWYGGREGGNFPLTEAGDAECFAHMYQDRARHDHRKGRWLISDDASGVSVPDPVEPLTQMAVEMMRERQRHAPHARRRPEEEGDRLVDRRRSPKTVDQHPRARTHGAANR